MPTEIDQSKCCVSFSLSVLLTLAFMFCARTSYASVLASSVQLERGKDYICKGDAQPPGSGIIRVDTAFTNLCGVADATFYLEKFKDDLVVCGIRSIADDPSLILAGYLLYPIDYIVSGVTIQVGCPSDVGWQIERLRRENTVCRLTDVLGPQVVVPSGYVVTGLADSPFDSCPGPLVNIKNPGAEEIVCSYSQSVLASAFYQIPPGYSVVGNTNSATCPIDFGALTNAWFIQRVTNPKKVGSTLIPSDCSIETSLKSSLFDTPTSVEFMNNSAQTVKIYWIDYSGMRVLYSVLSPGTSYVQPTYVTHPWVVTSSSDNCLGIYLPTASPSVAAIQ